MTLFDKKIKNRKLAFRQRPRRFFRINGLKNIFIMDGGLIRNGDVDKPVAWHFNSVNHSLSDMKLCAISQIFGGNDSRKRQENHLNFKIGTIHPRGLNKRFSFTFCGFMFCGFTFCGLCLLCMDGCNNSYLALLCLAFTHPYYIWHTHLVCWLVMF